MKRNGIITLIVCLVMHSILATSAYGSNHNSAQTSVFLRPGALAEAVGHYMIATKVGSYICGDSTNRRNSPKHLLTGVSLLVGTTLVHELGHAVTNWLFTKEAITIGLFHPFLDDPTTPLINLPMGRHTLHIGSPLFPGNGVARMTMTNLSPWQKIVVVAAGPISGAAASLLIDRIVFGKIRWKQTDSSHRLESPLCLSQIANLIPTALPGGRKTDGAHIREAWRQIFSQHS